MSSVIAVVSGNQVIQLGSRLVVGIRLQGTIGHINRASPFSVKPRPYLRYLAQTLRHLKCDVTLILPTGEGSDRQLVERFARDDFDVPFRLLHDHSTHWLHGGGGNKTAQVAPVNYTNYFTSIAAARGTSPSRVLFIDSEINYRFTPTQTLVLETYEPMTRRQQRQRAREVSQGGGPLPLSAALWQRSGRSARADALVGYTASIEGEQRIHAERSAGRTGWLGRHDQHASSATGAAARVRAPIVAEQVASDSGATAASRSAPHAGKRPANGSSNNSGTAATTSCTSLAINMDDFSLVALAEMIAEMAASEETVASYLRLEPLVEKLCVPMHGDANYLAIENCDDIDLLNWEEVQVLERESHDTHVPDIPETEEHKNFFR